MVVKGDSNKDGIIGTSDATYLMNFLINGTFTVDGSMF